jgi:hypothetical protein
VTWWAVAACALLVAGQTAAAGAAGTVGDPAAVGLEAVDLASTGVATADPAPIDLAAAEWELFGTDLSGDWQRGLGGGTQIGGERIGGVKQEEEISGPSSTGEKFKAGLLSAVLPGAGQFYNGDRTKAYVMAGVEVAIWGTFFVFDAQGDNRSDTYREYAGIYAGTSGEHNDDYWQAVGRYLDSDAYNEALLREARALEEPPPPLIEGADAWQWRNEDFFENYQSLRAGANSAYDRRDFVILFAVINRAVSVYDAVRNAGPRAPAEPTIGTEVLGWNVGLDVDASWRDPGSRAVVSRSF